MAIDIEALLTDISPDDPCGADIEYDPLYLELEQLVKGTPEKQEMQNQVIAAVEPNWKDVQERCLELLQRSRNMRVMIYLTLAAVCREGVSGLRDGLALLRGGLERYWDGIYPRLDPDDDLDPLERMNIVASLAPQSGAGGDTLRFRDRLLDAVLCTPSDSRLRRVTLRDVLIARGELTAPANRPEAPMDAGSIEATFDSANTEDLQASETTIGETAAELKALDTYLTGRLGAGVAPNLGGLHGLLKQMLDALRDRLARRGIGAPAASDGGSAAASGGDGRPQAALSGDITSTRDVLSAIDKICDYYGKVEPSSPVPLVLRRARRLVGKKFIDIIRDLSPGGIGEVETVTGIKAEEEYEKSG